MPINPEIPLSGRPSQIAGPMESYAQLLQLQQHQQQLDIQKQSLGALAEERKTRVQQAQADLAQKQRVQNSQQAIDALMSNAMVQDENGVYKFDRPTFEKGLIQGGQGHLYPQFSETLDKLEESQKKINTERNQSIARSIFAVQQAGNTPGAVQTAAAFLKKNNLIDDSHLQPVLEAVHQDESPENIGRVMQALGQGMPEYQALVTGEEKRKADVGKTSAEARKITAEAANLETYGRPSAPEPPKAGTFEDYTARYAQELRKPVAALTTADIETARKRYQQADEKPAAEDVALNLTPAGRDAAARNYAMTGQLPSLGMGKNGAKDKAAIVNRAAEMYPDLDLAANSADYRSSRGSLAKLQQQRDSIGAFEQTAGKNIDIFLREAGKVVDTGSPLANTAARLVSGKLLGSENQAAYDAARQVAINEIAKITSGSSNLGGTLSDSARHEVSAFNPQSATLKQTVAVMRILKQDMANRTIALDKQIEEVRGRFKDPNSKTQTPAVSPAAPTGVFSYQDYLKQKGGK